MNITTTQATSHVTNHYNDAYGNYNNNEEDGGTNSSGYSDDYYYDNYNYDNYNEYYQSLGGYFYYQGFSFERPIYLYFWEILVILTTLANVLVVMVLVRKNMRNATNLILIAIAVSDSLTGLITLPSYIYSYMQYENGDLKLSETACEIFMLTKFFLSRIFHTISIWLTVILGIQRLVSVSFPFKAQSMFTIPKTFVMIFVVSVLSPFLHIYHAINRKADFESGYCSWKLKDECLEGCIYLWLAFYLMHFIPCVLLVVVSILMVVKLCKVTSKMQQSQMISNQANLNRRNMESRRISAVVIAVVIVFLIPEIPYGLFLLISVSLMHAKENLLELNISRTFYCVYELLLVLSFHANFWIYIIMNRNFRRGLSSIFDPFVSLWYRILGSFGILRGRIRRRSSAEATSVGRTAHSEATSYTRTNSANFELKTYHINQDHENKSTNGSHSLMVKK